MLVEVFLLAYAACGKLFPMFHNIAFVVFHNIAFVVFHNIAFVACVQQGFYMHEKSAGVHVMMCTCH